MLVSLFCKERSWDSHGRTSVTKGHAASTWQRLGLPKVDWSGFQACMLFIVTVIPPPPRSLFCACLFQSRQHELLAAFIPWNARVIIAIFGEGISAQQGNFMAELI